MRNKNATRISKLNLNLIWSLFTKNKIEKKIFISLIMLILLLIVVVIIAILYFICYVENFIVFNFFYCDEKQWKNSQHKKFVEFFDKNSIKQTTQLSSKNFNKLFRFLTNRSNFSTLQFNNFCIQLLKCINENFNCNSITNNLHN